jgi:hypothetical protein
MLRKLRFLMTDDIKCAEELKVNFVCLGQAKKAKASGKCM